MTFESYSPVAYNFLYSSGQYFNLLKFQAVPCNSWSSFYLTLLLLVFNNVIDYNNVCGISVELTCFHVFSWLVF